MAIRASIRADFRPILKAIDTLQVKVKRAAIQTLSTKSTWLKKKIQEELPRVYDRPVPYLIGGVMKSPSFLKFSDPRPIGELSIRVLLADKANPRKNVGKTFNSAYGFLQYTLKNSGIRDELPHKKWLMIPMNKLAGHGPRLTRRGNVSNRSAMNALVESSKTEWLIDKRGASKRGKPQTRRKKAGIRGAKGLWAFRMVTSSKKTSPIKGQKRRKPFGQHKKRKVPSRMLFAVSRKAHYDKMFDFNHYAMRRLRHANLGGTFATIMRDSIRRMSR